MTIKGTTASAREKRKKSYSLGKAFDSLSVVERYSLVSVSSPLPRWFLQKIMFNRAKRGEMRHLLVQSDTVKTLVEYYGIQFRRQIE